MTEAMAQLAQVPGLEVFDCEQRSEDWYKARLGIPTASEFQTVIGRKKDGTPFEGYYTYMKKLAGDIKRRKPTPSYTNEHMDHGAEVEAEALNFYAAVTGKKPERIGFLRLNKCTGCSPDAVVGADGLVEVKRKQPNQWFDALLTYHEKGKLTEHEAQCQGALWISNRKWLDLVIYYPDMDDLIITVKRDEEMIERIARSVARFNEELAALVKEIDGKVTWARRERFAA